MKSQISHIVVDSGWEKAGLEFERDRISGLVSWAKNDHLGFEIFYLWQGQTKTYFPDYIIRFEGNRHLILEIKGQIDVIVKTTQEFEMFKNVIGTVVYSANKYGKVLYG